MDRNLLVSCGNLLTGQVVSKLLLLATFGISTRLLPAEEWGMFAYVLSLLYLIQVVSDFGFHSFTVRATAEGSLCQSRVRQIVLFRIALGIVASLVAYVALRLAGSSVPVLVMTMLMCASIPFRAFYATVRSLAQGREQMHWSALIDSVFYGAFFTFTLGSFLIVAPRAELLAASWLAAGVVTALLTRRIYERVAPDDSVATQTLSDKSSWSLLRQTVPFVLMTGATVLLHRADVVMLERMRTIEEVGYYSAAYHLLDGLSLIALLFATALLPRLVRHGRISSERIIWLGLLSATIITVPAAALWMLSQHFVTLVYGSDFASCAGLLRVLLLSAPALGMLVVCGNHLIALHLERLSLIATACALLANILLNLYFIPRLGSMGAAYTTAITLTLNAVLHLLFVLFYRTRNETRVPGVVAG